MSTGLELVPLALAAGVAIAAVRRRTGRSREPVLAVGTRLRDEDLLVAALRGCGQPTGVVDGLQHGVVDGVELALTPGADGTWSVLFDGTVPAGTAEAVVLSLDAAYCAELADRLTRELRDRAAELGLTSSDPRPGPDGGAVVSVRAASGEGAAIRIRPDGRIGATTFGSTGERCLPWIATIEHCSAATSVRSEYTSDFFATGSIGLGSVGHSTAQQAEQAVWQQG